FFFFFSSRRRHTRFSRDWSSDVCSSDLALLSRIPSRLHRYFLRVGPCPAWLLSLHASRTHQDESSLSRSALPSGELPQGTMASEIGRASCRGRVWVAVGARAAQRDG